MEFEKPPPYSPPEGVNYPPPNSQPGGFPAAMTQPAAYVSAPPASTYQATSVPAGYQTVNTSALPNYGSTVYVQQPLPQTQIIYVGGCPACKVGVLEDDFTCLGVLCAILFFPIGLLCCFAMRQRRCPNCGAIFG